MPAKLLLVQNWGRMAHLPQPTTGTSSVMNTLHYHRLYQINSSLEDMKQLRECVERSHLHTGNLPCCPKLIIKPDLF